MEIVGLEVYRPGVGWIALGSVAAVTLANGDTLRVTVTSDYVGPAQTLTLYGAVGVSSQGKNAYSGLLGFDEALTGKSDWPLPASTTPTPVTDSVDIPIVVSYDATPVLTWGYDGMLPPGDAWDLYVKIKENSAVSNELDGVVNLSTEGAGGTPPTPDIFSQMMPLIMLMLVVGMMSGMMPAMQGKETE